MAVAINKFVESFPSLVSSYFEKRELNNRVKRAEQFVKEAWGIVGGVTGENVLVTEMPLLLRAELDWVEASIQRDGLSGRDSWYINTLRQAQDVYSPEGRQAAITIFARVGQEAQGVLDTLGPKAEHFSLSARAARRKLTYCQIAQQKLSQ